MCAGPREAYREYAVSARAVTASGCAACQDLEKGLVNSIQWWKLSPPLDSGENFQFLSAGS